MTGLFRTCGSIMTSEISDSAFCHVCVGTYHQNCITVNNIESRSISEEYTNWKNATCEGRVLYGRKESVEHSPFLRTCTEDVEETFSCEHSVEKSVNHQALLKILSNV